MIACLTTLPSGVHAAALPELCLISVSGDDALTFLHGQLTQDVLGLTQDDARPAAYCTAKGRILGSLVMWRAPAGSDAALQALLPADTAAGVVKRLRMFVLRAKAVFADVPAAVSGVWADSPQAASALAQAVPGLPQTAWQRHTADDGVTWIAAPRADDGPAARWWVIAPGAQPTGEAPAAAWQAQDIAAGLPWITQPTLELFTPQMVNLDLLGGVSFTKGCYPGQEIVARSHYLGKQKRRMLLGLVAGDVSAAAGQDVFDAQRAGEPVGRVVSAAVDGGHVSLLFEAHATDAPQADLRLAAPDGPAIRLAALPYAVGPAV